MAENNNASEVWEGPAYEYGVTWGPMAEQPVPLLRDRRPEAPGSSFFGIYYGAGHELDDPKGRGPVRCVNCGAQAIDLFEDAAYGDVRKCISPELAAAIDKTRASIAAAFDQPSQGDDA